MSDSEKIKTRPSLLERYAWTMGAVWTVVVAASLIWNVFEVKHQTLEAARIQAQFVYEKDVIFRRWNAQHGGIYVPVTEETPPNPYLSHIPDRDISTPAGKLLTLMNPAYMTRQVHELAEKEQGIRGHITSLNPIRPENSPDPWETKALQALESGQTEISSVEEMEGKEVMRLMRPLVTEKGCLGCHAAQGYKEGDIRGGISISIPMASLKAIARTPMLTFGLGHVLLWLIGLGGIVLATERLKQRESARRQAAEALEKAKDELEIRVEERTSELEIANEQLREEITERKKAEDQIRASLKEKEVLLQEVHHRVKNNMQIICSLFSLQSGHIKDKQSFEIFESSQNRVKSMAIIHERFYQSEDMSRIDFAKYTQSLMSHLFSAHGINPGAVKLNLKIKDVFLDLNTAIPCGLIINELVSNSLKHAFPDDKKGKMNIAMRSLKGNEIELLVSDNGVGLPKKVDFRKTDSLGLHLVNLLAEGQLHGDIKLDRTKGTSFHIKFKVKR